MKKQYGKLALAFVSLLLFQMLAWSSSAALKDCYPSVSLRFQEPLGEDEVEQIMDHTSAACTFWREESGEASIKTSSIFATAIRYQGSTGAIQTLTFLAGAEPITLAENQCLISSEFAMHLWGSANVVGQSFYWQEDLFTVSGVFEDKQISAFLPARSTDAFTCIELSGDLGDDPVAAASDFLMRAGLNDCQSCLYGPWLTGFLSLLNWAPLLLCGLWGLLRLRRLYPIQDQMMKRILFWSGLFLTAIALPILVGQLPGWLSPPKWSDFHFWSELLKSAAQRLEEWFRLAPLERDVAAKYHAASWAVGWLGSLFSASWGWFYSQLALGEVIGSDIPPDKLRRNRSPQPPPCLHTDSAMVRK